MEHTRPASGELSPVPAALAPADPAEVQRGLTALGEALKIEAQPTKKGGKVTEVQKLLAEKERRAVVRQGPVAFQSLHGGHTRRAEFRVL